MLIVLMPKDELHTAEEPIDEDTAQTSLPFTFVFRAVHINTISSLGVERVQSRLIAVKEETISFESLSSYETLKTYIHDMILNLDIRICARVRDPYKEKIAIMASDIFRANQARRVRTVAFIAALHIVEEFEQEEDIIIREIAEETMDMGPPMVPASRDSVEKLLNARQIEKDETDEACTVCLEHFLVGLEVKVMPCGHIFHGDCIIKWLQQSHFCPLCRFSMPIDDD